MTSPTSTSGSSRLTSIRPDTPAKEPAKTPESPVKAGLPAESALTLAIKEQAAPAASKPAVNPLRESDSNKHLGSVSMAALGGASNSTFVARKRDGMQSRGRNSSGTAGGSRSSNELTAPLGAQSHVGLKPSRSSANLAAHASDSDVSPAASPRSGGPATQDSKREDSRAQDESDSSDKPRSKPTMRQRVSSLFARNSGEAGPKSAPVGQPESARQSAPVGLPSSGGRAAPRVPVTEMCAVLSVPENREVFVRYLRNFKTSEFQFDNTDSFYFVDECSKLIASFPTLSPEGKRQALQQFMDIFFAPYKPVSFSAPAVPASREIDINLRFDIKVPLELEWQQIRRGEKDDYSDLLGYLDHAMDFVLGPIADSGGPFPQARQVCPELERIPVTNPNGTPLRPWPAYFSSSPDRRPPVADQQTAARMRAQADRLANNLPPDKHLSEMINLPAQPFGGVLQMFLDAAGKRDSNECWELLREIANERRKGDREKAVAGRDPAIAAASALVDLWATYGGSDDPARILNKGVTDAVQLLLE
jgi:hypothetical protein